MKNNIKEQQTNQTQVVTMNDKDKLLKAKSFGCFPKWLENGRIGDYEGKKVFYGTNSKKETVVFFADMTAKNINTDKNANWKCPQLEETVGTTPEKSSFTPDQQSYINGIIKSEGVIQTKPSDYETEKGKWEVIDLNTRNSKLFPESGKYFVYKQKGELSNVSPQQDNIINALINQGFKKEQPAANESDLFVKVNLQTIESGKYKEYFSQPFYMYQPIKDINMSDLLFDRKRKFDDQKVDVKQCRQSIDILYTAYVKKYKLEDSERIALKNYVQRCSQQVSRIFGAQKKLDTLLNLRPDDPSKLSLKLRNESFTDLKKIVRESLLEAKELKKKRVLTESEIVKNRFYLIAENIDFNTKKGQNKFSNDLMLEMIYLNKQGFGQEIINEQFWDMIKGLFGHGGDAIMQTFKESIANFILKQLGVDSNGWIGGTIVKAIGNVQIGDIPKLTECNFLTAILSKSIAEQAIDKLKNAAGMEGAFYDLLRNSLVEVLEDSTLGQKLESAIGSIVCPLLGGVKQKMELAATDMKQKALS